MKRLFYANSHFLKSEPGRNNRPRMGFYCVLTLSPDVSYLFLPKIGQKCQNRRFLGISTSKSGDTMKFGNFGILAISATLPDGSNSKSPKIGQKRQNQRFLGEIHIQIW